MIPQRHPRTTRYLGAPVGWEPETQGDCSHLAIADIPTQAGPAMDSLWEPTPEELRQLNEGGSVCLTVFGVAHPPVGLSVVERRPE